MNTIEKRTESLNNQMVNIITPEEFKSHLYG